MATYIYYEKTPIKKNKNLGNIIKFDHHIIKHTHETYNMYTLIE